MNSDRLRKLLFSRAHSFAGAAAGAFEKGAPAAYTLGRIAEELHNLIDDSGLREEFEHWEMDFCGE